MLVLVANLGSTSFKYRLFDMTDERCLARGSVERIGASESTCVVEIGDWTEQRTMSVPDHGVAVTACLEQLTDPEHGVLQEASQVAA
ncbi:MAG: acetate/propionate family kinase, partial [Planctomycetes bacterium]|nr:acetate/propionate family kinase [Planctomycetota bacterium]